MTEPIWKLVDRAEWEAAGSLYTGSATDLADGYIHMSTTAQLAETAARHFRGRTDLLLIELAPEALGPRLVWEVSRGGAHFPHLYEPLPRAAALSARSLSVDRSGVMHFADGAVGWP